jgi:hypothetical protein
MKQYSTFIFDSFVFNPEAGMIELNYSFDDELFFTETLILPTPYPLPPTPSPDAALFALHLIGGISYFKTCCPKAIKIRSGSLTEEQTDFWNTVYTKGLGEFFFRNQIDFRGLINFPSLPQTTNNKKQTPFVPMSQVPSPKSRLLVPIGGGKDSTVTAELLKKAGYDVTLFRIGRHPLIEATAKIAGLPLLTVERHLAPELFKLNAEGALNGHVPITAYLSFLAIVIAEMYGFDAVVMSNERSASEGNVDYLGDRINHQWSKSIEFERMLRSFLKNNGSSVEYFSLLRPLSELSIVKIFTALPQYFSCVTSCNTNWKLIPKPALSADEGSQVPSPKSGAGRWCGSCPKCAFAFTMFAAFLPKKQLTEIFGKNLFDEDALQPFFRQLLGIEGFKPFECVGTPEETQAAFLLAHERGDLDQSSAMKLFLEKVLPTVKQPGKLTEEVLKSGSDHCIPQPFLSLITQSEVLSPKS